MLAVSCFSRFRVSQGFMFRSETRNREFVAKHETVNINLIGLKYKTPYHLICYNKPTYLRTKETFMPEIYFIQQLSLDTNVSVQSHHSMFLISKTGMISCRTVALRKIFC